MYLEVGVPLPINSPSEKSIIISTDDLPKGNNVIEELEAMTDRCNERITTRTAFDEATIPAKDADRAFNYDQTL